MIATTPAGALFSVDRKYRYALWRVWDSYKPLVMFIGLNPSTANELTNDATIRRLAGKKGFAKKFGYGGMVMTNLFGYISTKPEVLMQVEDPLGQNDLHLHTVRNLCEKVVFCWGNFSIAEARSKDVIAMFHDSWCLGKNANGTPKHPLYLKGGTKLVKF